jgi:hypothetical protein
MNNSRQLMLAVHLRGENREYFPMNVHGPVAQWVLPSHRRELLSLSWAG